MERKEKGKKSAIGYAISSRIGIYRDRGWPPPSYTRVKRVRENSRDLFAYDSLDGLSDGFGAGSGLERVTRIFIKRYEDWNEPDENQYLIPSWEYHTSATLPPLSTLDLSCLHTLVIRHHLAAPFPWKSEKWLKTSMVKLVSIVES